MCTPMHVRYSCFGFKFVTICIDTLRTHAQTYAHVHCT